MKNKQERIPFNLHLKNKLNPDTKKIKLLFRNMTLVEILFVVIIMGLLLSISLPSFSDMVKGSGTEAAIRNMGQALKMARTHAINNNKYVALLMPSQIGTHGRPVQSFSQIGDLYYNRSYRFCYVTKRSGYDYNFKQWIQNEDWQYLPDGALFLEMNTTKGVHVSSNALDPEEGTINRVFFVDYRGAGGVKMTGTTNDETTAAIVFKPSGKISGLGRYLEIGEGAFSANQQVVTNRDPKAYVSIKVDQYTGRVSYGDE